MSNPILCFLEYSPLTVQGTQLKYLSVPNQPLHYQHVSSLFPERVHVSIFLYLGYGGKIAYFFIFFQKISIFFKFYHIIHKYFLL